jgi:hypothetical protein
LYLFVSWAPPSRTRPLPIPTPPPIYVPDVLPLPDIVLQNLGSRVDLPRGENSGKHTHTRTEAQTSHPSSLASRPHFIHSRRDWAVVVPILVLHAQAAPDRRRGPRRL